MIHTGDCLEVMATLDAESIDAIVTDPPYDLTSIVKRFGKTDSAPVKDDAFGGRYGRLAKGFMGKTWDGTGVAFDPATWAAAYRVAKPGAFLLAFGGTRTVHRMTCAIEDAGWEIRDVLMWGYATGFPKSLNVSKAIDKAAGARREVVGERVSAFGDSAESETGDGRNLWAKPSTTTIPLTGAPVTDDAAKWQGWGTALKPAWEPIVMARKPLRGTVAASVLEFGTGALNIDGCRIGTTKDVPASGSRHGDVRTHGKYGPEDGTAGGFDPNLGRWPANILLTDPIFDGGWDGVVGGGEQDSGSAHTRRGNGIGFGSTAEGDETEVRGGSGTYSRFFIIPKASRKERGEGNTHPTVKPVALMRHLVRLVTPPGGTVLDPFLGSGTSALAAEEEGFEWIGIEREAEYVAMAETRLMAAFLGSLQDGTEAL